MEPQTIPPRLKETVVKKETASPQNQSDGRILRIPSARKLRIK